MKIKETSGEKMVQRNLNGFPNGVTVGTNDHGAANRTVIGQLSIGDNVEIPRVEVLRSWRDDSLGDFLRVVDSVLRLRRSALGGERGGEWALAEVVAPPENRGGTARDGGGRGRG